MHMSETRVRIVQVSLKEIGDKTDAEAVLELGGRRFGGWGRARHNPADPDVPRIGEELATARALSDLSHRLLEASAAEIEKFEGRRVHVHT